ncbi:MAG: cysteine--tRNA ligase [Deltaproteobacteria bacterium GWB2_55_19]|nr:MAG: cysteine--tRNA ligase [Deltaproteobacteria bacterium GWB2_55_19]
MPIKVYNSLTRKKEDFTPVEEGKVRMYVCGPTVYALSHIGHARSAVSFDVIYKYLKYRGYEVKYARNYTDVDDKIIQKANEEGVSSEELAERFIKAFDEDMEALGVEVPTFRPKATGTIKKIIEVTETLIRKGAAYELDGDVYYSVRLKKDYGKLSGKNIDDLESGARVDVDERKRDPLDFALWKSSKPGEPAWDSPWSKGRPGWHIECSAMCMEWLGETIDIHGGGKDLIFPHHENEIAQSEAATGKTPYVKYWLHNGFVNIEKEKMSKSIGNILNIRDVLKDYTADALRLFLLSSQYRSPIDYTRDSLKDAESAMERFYKTVQRMKEEYPSAFEVESCIHCIEDRISEMTSAMDDDFNTAEVIGTVFKEVTRANKLMDETKATGEKKGVWTEISYTLSLFKEAGRFLGLFTRTPEEYFGERNSRATMPAEEIERLIKEREEARKRKDFKAADAIRNGLLEKGIVLEDSAKGTTWSVKK